MAFKEQVRLLVGQANPKQMYSAQALGAIDPRAYVGETRAGTHVAADGSIRMVSEPAAMLQKLYSISGPEDRAQFVPILFTFLTVDNARVIARSIAATKNLGVLLDLQRLDTPIEILWRGLIHTLRFEPGLFDDGDLDIVLAGAIELRKRAYADGERLKQLAAAKGVEVEGVRRHSIGSKTPFVVVTFGGIADEVRAVLDRVRYLRLAKTLQEGRNPAIDADRQVLISRLTGLGYSDQLVKVSHEIEQKANLAQSEIDAKTTMDLLRTFYEEFIEESCRKVEKKVGKDAPAGPKVNHFAPYREYLATHAFVGPEESELLQKLYNFISNTGTHKLSSAPEQLRVTHAMVIELCMLIAGRVAAYLK